MSAHNNLDYEFFHKILVIDIETVPVYSDFNQLDESYRKHWMRKHEQVTRFSDEETDCESSFFKKAGIYAEFGKIICISLGRLVVENDIAEVKIKSYAHADEKLLLQEFFSDIMTFSKKWPDIRLAGHNIKEFDVPYICRRALVHGLMLPNTFQVQGLKPWQILHIDSLELWKFGDYKHYVSLDLLAHLLGVESSKIDIDGSQVAEQFWIHNDIDRIVKYCERDVVTTTQVIAKLLQWHITIRHS